MSEPELISYRRLLYNFGKELKSDEVKKLAYVYLDDADVDSSSEGEGFRLLLKLQRMDMFSFQDVSGLIRVAGDANRKDWEKTFKDFAQARSSGSQVRRKVPTPLPSEERQHLEHVQDAFFNGCLSLEDGFQEARQKETVTKEDGLKLLQKCDELMQELQLKTKQATKMLKNVISQSNSGYSSSGSSSGSEYSTSPPVTTWTSLPTSYRSKDEPMPIPRRPKTPPPYKSVTQEVYREAVQESTPHASPIQLRVPATKVAESHNQPPPIPPKKSPRLHQQPATSMVYYHRSSVCVHPQKKLSDEEENDDQTGDSGMGTGSGAAQYGTVEEWKGAIKNPPDSSEGKSESKQLYTTIRDETKDKDPVYQEVERK